MSVVSRKSVVADAARPESFHLWRSRKDSAVRWMISVGGVGVIFAVVLIFFYLMWVVFPLFLPAGAYLEDPIPKPAWAQSQPVYLSVEEQRVVGLRLSDDGNAEFFHIDDGHTVEETRLPFAEAAGLAFAAETVEHDGFVAAVTRDGRVHVFRHQYETTFAGGVDTRRIIPTLSYPYGEQALLELPVGEVAALAYSDTDDELLLAAAERGGMVRINLADKSENLLTGDLNLDPTLREMSVEFEVTSIGVSNNHRWLYLGDSEGRVHSFTVPALEESEVIPVSDGEITAMTMLLGGISVLAGDSMGRVSQLFPVRGEDNRFHLQPIRTFTGSDGAVERVITEQRRKGFITLDEADNLNVFHSTSGRHVLQESLAATKPRAIALSPRANGLLIERSDASMQMLQIENEHPEVSFSTLWSKVWYENYEEPEYVWQSSASTNEFEPKFSLTPLVFGTIKAAFYAMLFAIPLALMGAAYTAYFMSPELRKWVKPGIEIMAALPTVILGFLAGLWFAPWVEAHLADLFLMLILIPPGLLLFAWVWHRLGISEYLNIPDGWEPLLLVPALLGLGALAMYLGEPLEVSLFQGDFRQWMTQELGISYDQRNALVVGCAMGFAVIPTIFSIAEDAVFGVPDTLSNGSLALGATPWQTLVFVILPTASPGIFSALMIGLGRAVGETMIVLMATGNTPVMDWNLFEGMRTLAANIAVEMPESEVNSTHYRILFLAALVLFLFTFVVNTAAELVRQHLREKYSSL